MDLSVPLRDFYQYAPAHLVAGTKNLWEFVTSWFNRFFCILCCNIAKLWHEHSYVLFYCELDLRSCSVTFATVFGVWICCDTFGVVCGYRGRRQALQVFWWVSLCVRVCKRSTQETGARDPCKRSVQKIRFQETCPRNNIDVLLKETCSVNLAKMRI